MSSLNTINVGGISYDVEDASSRTIIPMVAYKEDGDTASQAYAVIGTPINWKGTLYYTKTAVAQGATWVVDTNLTIATNLGGMMSNIKTYVNDDGDLVFRDLTGADSVLPFSSMELGTPTSVASPYTATKKCIAFVAGTYPGGWSDGYTSRYGNVTIYKNNVAQVSKTEYLTVTIQGDVRIGIPFAAWCGVLEVGDVVKYGFSANGYVGATRASIYIITLE